MMRTTPRYRVPPGFFHRASDGSLLAAATYRVVEANDEEYPPGFEGLEDPPSGSGSPDGIFARSARWSPSPGRRANAYGLTQAHRLAGDLAARRRVHRQRHGAANALLTHGAKRDSTA